MIPERIRSFPAYKSNCKEPRWFPTVGLLQVGLAQTPPPRGPAVCPAHGGGVGGCSGEDEAKDQGACRETQIHRDEEKSCQVTKANLVASSRFGPISIFHIQGGKKSVVGLERVRCDQRKLSSLNQAHVCCPQVFTG